MLLRDLLQILDDIAPTRLAESWDNVGLLAGDPAQPITRALLAIDYTPQVAAEAAEQRCELVVAYHPPIFNALSRITAPSLIFDTIRHGMAIYSPHTALDVADGGTNDLLADVLGLRERQPLRLIEPKARAYKLVTFVPEADVDRVASALFDAGAGRIGHYTRCSFRSPGTGTFMGDESTNPTVGEKCVHEQAPELKIETICPIARLADVLAALRASHPYEEPAFDLVQLAAPPEKLGQGRIGTITPMPLDELIRRIKRELGLTHLLVAKANESAPITRAACLAGAGREHVKDAMAQKAQIYLTGEIPHHDALAAAAAGVTVIATLHSNSERAVLKRLGEKLSAVAPDVSFQLSAADRDPFQVV
jgi:dinuclear metal center YbgI/SA1388 family protein